MKTPYGLNVIDNCLVCEVRDKFLFCDISDPALKDLEKIRTTASYPKGAVLFVEGQEADGIYILCQGKAKLSTSSASGKTFIMRVAEPGDVLGLSSAVSGRQYDATAEVMEPSQVNHFFRPDFLRLAAKHGEVALRVAQVLSNNYHQACEEIRSLSLSENAAVKLARLMLDWAQNNGKLMAMDPKNTRNIRMTYTHDEIAQLIGTSRETVTRMISIFKRKKLIEIKGSILTLCDHAAIVRMVESN